MKFLKVLLLTVLVILSSCDRFQENRKIVLRTDRPELIAYAEAYNAESEYKVEVVYSAEPAKELADGKCTADLVIAPYLNSKQVTDSLMPLDNLFTESVLDRDSFYLEALEQGRTEKGQVALPVSFNIPVFLFRSGEVKHSVSSFNLDSNSFAVICSEFNSSKTSYRKSSFSPLWDNRIPFFFALLSDNNFYESENGKFTVNDVQLENRLQFMRGLISRFSGDFDGERYFREKFLYMPQLELLEKRRIFFSFSDVASFSNIPESSRRNLNFRFYLNEKNRIAVCENMLYAAIPGKSGNSKGAGDFLAWMMNEKVQTEMLGNAENRKIRGFGIAGGFSSLKGVNEKSFPKLYPFMVGHIPTEEILSFPVPCPPDFDRLRDEAIIPWLYTQTGQPSTTSDLMDTVDSWRRMNAAL